MHFKTSYVEVYLVVFLDWIARKIDFKTSYVEVYRRSIIQTRKPTAISKHLMLKFIG